jgi:hypothetical protein
MNRQTIVDQLTEAERHVNEAMMHVAEQRGLVARLERNGYDTTNSREVLTVFEECLARHIADRDRLITELARPDLA